ncbi:MAG: hypothetical protein LUG24_07500 [Clostridiales bacterium]|nr:hypothetical protein [Clostridiales bacterium]
MEMANKVVKSLMSNYEKAMKGVESVMGGTVLEYKAKTIYREGETKGWIKGKTEGMIETLAASIKALMENGQYNFDSAFNLIKAPTDKYNQIKELVLGATDLYF